MNILEIVAESIWWVLHNSAVGVLTFLELNYSTVSLIIFSFQIISKVCCDFFSSVFDVLKCCYYDFLAFYNELASCIGIFTNVMMNFLLRRKNEICYLSYCVIDSFNSLSSKSIAAVNDVRFLLNELLQNTLYFLTVVFNAILFILQLGPNLLIFIYEALIFSCAKVLNLLQFLVYVLLEKLYELPSVCLKVICNVPFKAYFGFMLLIILFHARFVIKKYLKRCTKLVIRHCTTLWYNIIPKTIANTILLYKRCKRYAFPEASETNESVPITRRIFRLVILAFQYLQNMIYFLKVPISRVNEELSDHEVQELQKKLYAERERHVCVICHDRERNILLYPCRHMCMCEECSTAVRAAYQGCPLCRRNIIDTFKVFN